MRYVRHIVLDEADTLMDDSFNELMTHFLSRFKVRLIFIFFMYLKYIFHGMYFIV